MGNEDNICNLGIGNGADRHLVKGMARAGLGTYAFTNYNENISGKVIRQLKDGLQPCVYNVSLDWGGQIQDFCQAPLQVPPLYDGTRMLVYTMWSPETKLASKVIGFIKHR